jgi:2-polyprenyl-6-methoxyphenol hydroxylase-like FAD-dependent oxidoreductase
MIFNFSKLHSISCFLVCALMAEQILAFSPPRGSSAMKGFTKSAPPADKNRIAASTPLHVVINGGGPAGLALAVAFKNCPHVRVTVFEKRSKIETRRVVPGRVYSWKDPNCFQVLKEVDIQLAQHVAKICKTIDKVELDVGGFCVETKSEFVVCDRALLLKTMQDCLPDNIVKHESEVIDYTERADKRLIVHCSSNETLVCDVLVGADGIWSSIRSKVNGSSKSVSKSRRGGVRQMNFRIWTSAGAANRSDGERMRICFGERGFMFALGLAWFHFVRADSSSAVVSQVNGLGDASFKRAKPLSQDNHDALERNFRDSSTALEIIRSTPMDSIFEAPLFDYPPSPDKVWSNGSVVLIGDAINAVSPIAGNGCMEAMKDAIVLKQELEVIKSREQIIQALANYKKRRLMKRSAVNIIGFWMLNAATGNPVFGLPVTGLLGSFLAASLFLTRSGNVLSRNDLE